MWLTHALDRVRRSHRHVTRTNAGVFGLTSVLVAVLVVGSLQLRPTAALQPTLPRAAPVPAASSPAPPARPAVSLPTLPRLRSLISPVVLVSTPRPLSAAQVRSLVALTGANASLQVAVGEVGLGRGLTRALAADPVKTRVWTPATTGRATGVWQRAVIGEAVVAHAAAKANGVPLGGTVVVRRGTRAVQMRIGAFATTQLPGVGLVVNVALGRQLGLVPGTGLLLAVPGTDPAVVVALVQRALGNGALVDPVLSAAAPTFGWVPPVIGTITSPFGPRLNPITNLPQFHEGVDIGAPLGAPVYAMTAGQVLYAGPASGYGNEIVLSHAGGVSTIYGHVSQILVSSGAVKTGQVIALVGNEGESTGPHVHAEVHVQNTPVDPVKWLEDHGVRVIR